MHVGFFKWSAEGCEVCEMVGRGGKQIDMWTIKNRGEGWGGGGGEGLHCRTWCLVIRNRSPYCYCEARASLSTTSQVRALEKKPSKKSALEQLLKDSFRMCLVAPLGGAMVMGRQRSCVALTQAWLVYIRRQQASPLFSREKGTV